MNVINKPLICPSCMSYRNECECETVNPTERGPGTHDRYGNKLEPILTTQAIKNKAKKMKEKIEALKLEALNVSVYLEDNGHTMASAHFLSIGDGLNKAKDAAELLS